MGRSLQRFLELAESFAYVPLWTDLEGDLETPVSLVKKLGGCIYLLESVEKGETLGRHSFIGVDPLLWFEVGRESCTITRESEVTLTLEGDPLSLLQTTLGELKVAPCAEIEGFFGGAVGYFGYDMVHRIEKLPRLAEEDLNIPESKFVVTRCVLVMDHITKGIRVVVLAKVGADPLESYKQGIAYLKSIVKKINSGSMTKTKTLQRLPKEFEANLTKAQFIAAVERAKEYIRAGDIFQVVLSQRLSYKIQDEPFEIYRRLRVLNPSPYLFYLNLGDTVLVGSSPEMLVRVNAGRVETCPIAGTRPRGKSASEDSLLAEELLANPKERAEHIMLLDLSRNDLGRVCKYDSIKLEEFMEVEKFSHVMHLVSRVKGYLNPGYTAFDALKACFPAGTVSGAPKVRAMEIIEELEPTRRGPYAGAIGYLSFGGDLDSCITIRTIMIKDQRAYIQAGAGIVADSDPQKEYVETLNKARALMYAVSPQEDVYAAGN